VARTAALTLIVAVVYLLLGIGRMGFVARFFAKPVLDGFVIGLGAYIAVGQLNELVGISAPDATPSGRCSRRSVTSMPGTA
jgi:MFS superfamily sulfate permease-like transporter